jgi:hypothetical protein
MQAFIVEIENRAGQLSRIVGALGDAGINITSGAGLGISDTGGFGFLTDDEAGAHAALNAAGISYRTVDVVVAKIPNRAGGLAAAARRLSGAGVNVHFVVPLSIGEADAVAFGVLDAEAARTALGELAG